MGIDIDLDALPKTFVRDLRDDIFASWNSLPMLVDRLSSMASALASVHEAGVVFRDVHPPNFVLCGPTLKLTDFGYACPPDAIDPSEVLGTVDYMAPEIMKEQGASTSSDMF